MYSARVHRVQEADIEFSEDDYNQWKAFNPKANNSHEAYIEEIVQVMAHNDDCWTTSGAEIICIVYIRDDRE